MNNKKIGQFIYEQRKSKKMTQKELASRLNITDKAVSKWERGLSCPDISLLNPLAVILDVTTSEILNGEKNSNDIDVNDIETSVDNALSYAEKTVKVKLKSFKNIFTIVFSVMLLIGMVVCTICDLAISGTLSWSLYPTGSIIFTWLVFFPVVKFGKKGILGTIISLSILIIPYIFFLNFLIKTSRLLLPIGIGVSIISIVYIWIVFAVFKVLKNRKMSASAISLLLGIPTEFLITYCLTKYINEPMFDVWDFISIAVMVITALLLFIGDFKRNKVLWK